MLQTNYQELVESKKFQYLIDQVMQIEEQDQKTITTAFRQDLPCIKNYVLQSNGQFIQSLVENCSEELQKPAKDVRKHVLLDCLENSIAACKLFGKESIRLYVLLNEPEFNIQRGWDLFSLDFTCNHKFLNMESYQKISNFLFRIKYVEQLCVNNWKNFMIKCKTDNQQIPQKNRIFNEMTNFIKQLYMFAMQDVIEMEWNIMMNEMREKEDLLSLVTIHLQFQQSVLSRLFLTEKYKNIHQNILYLMKIIETFLNLLTTENPTEFRDQSYLRDFLKYQKRIKEDLVELNSYIPFMTQFELSDDGEEGLFDDSD